MFKFFNFNKIIKILILSDVILLSGWGLIAPVLAIFITQQIKGGDVKVAGIAVGIYWLLNSLLQFPIGKYLDINHGEKDDFYFIIGGTLLASLTPIGFIFSTLPWHVYFLQAIYAIGMAMAFPAWYAIFTRYINRGKEGQIWGLYNSIFGIGIGIAGIIGGIVAKNYGFIPLFVAISILGVISALLMFLIKKELFFNNYEKPRDSEKSL